MDGKQRKYNGQFEITDLIDDAINNALFRRNQAMDSQDALSALSDEEAAKVAGGDNLTVSKICLPIIIGLIAENPKTVII
ncbi:MAG: hypothetical protein DSM106950_03640 [Stigonema ocellatum SAG 48.90 = DSM 106950]|nr:hypothetical protein [Stigonema ocellatum SAG 48.90 = DSM 106950]